ncbi:hypothetical protein llap_19256 [Limosa lapponica baueri]|uniref:Uncharacterized protein n=1 Tax=Limosa lapponica baueri TaxID=1758121 RepID=A0A2I0T9F4_LIMLA|nr:hypothetical protein llap_19256 [Limosa lapponica baueri]
MPKSPPKPKNGSRIPEPQKPTKGKEIWLAFQDVPTLLTNLLSQLETFMFARKCPFPHVVRAGAIFIPIHVVKEKLFPKLPGASVDQVLQEHKVELRPTTLSEERHLRDLELKSCTSRMLKLLALKQLPDIYPDLLNLHWHDSIRQQLGNEVMPEPKAGSSPALHQEMLRLGTSLAELEKLLSAAGDQGDVLTRGLLALVCGMRWGRASSCHWGGLGEFGGPQPEAPAVPLHSCTLSMASPKQSPGVGPPDPTDITALHPKRMFWGKRLWFLEDTRRQQLCCGKVSVAYHWTGQIVAPVAR